ncbi:Swt1 family HEPN domain-containing protein [Metabacillus hrfriensis]|uniref:Swt1 family HEPN domain-containing protein n=1 Tax=Metabacillus hrfriensis TaxID=3048891 RepID=A0ACD4REK1_9BACI|nr:Swt1 family HEPN domain-containing protein [Metabacillus sp. CT-WN-B3]WHZ58778.1 Swt1 family HEPN domain-containing protein [Metabacillus sp. CT-WN-B3]
MSDFTYTLPFANEKYLSGILRELKRKGEIELYNFLNKSSLSIDNLGTSFYVDRSGRWNAQGINIKFYVNPANIDSLNIDTNKHKLFIICNNLIPGEVGFDLKEIVFAPDLSIDFEDEEDILTDLENKVGQTSNSILKRILPEDIREKGKYMAEVYTYLYSVENSLRVFIEIVSKEKYGEDYFSKLKITKSLENTISGRKEKAKNKKWLSVRGNNDLFYLDFKDIGTLINNNWDIFEGYFDTQDFILPKINEMAECRNLIAHNSYIGKTERDLLKSYYNSILKQIEDKFDDSINDVWF